MRETTENEIVARYIAMLTRCVFYSLLNKTEKNDTKKLHKKQKYKIVNKLLRYFGIDSFVWIDNVSLKIIFFQLAIYLIILIIIMYNRVLLRNFLNFLLMCLMVISIRIPIISTRILVELTRKFWFIYFQSEFQLIQPNIFV